MRLGLRQPIQSAGQAAEGMQPGNCSLHEPVEVTKAAAVLCVAGGQCGVDPQQANTSPAAAPRVKATIAATIRAQPFLSRDLIATLSGTLNRLTCPLNCTG